MKVTTLANTKEYLAVVEDIKGQIALAQQRIIQNANRELVVLYWNVGRIINERKTWGDGFIVNLARDIRGSFPTLRGFSERNLRYMIKFASICMESEILQQVLQNLPWRHNIMLMERLNDKGQRLWYAEQALENGWSSNILDMQIDRGLYARQVTAGKTTNFTTRLPAPQGELAQQMLKDPYIFDIVEYRNDMVERDVENALVKSITKFLLELGNGFSFVGQQYHVEVGGEDFYIDLLFYHLKLRCFVVMELKMREFVPEYAGKLNFYVSAVDGHLRQPGDNPTIGILLCKRKNKIIAEYALNNITSPISVNEFKLLDVLPKEYEDILPTAEDIASRLKLPVTSDDGKDA